MGERAQLEMLAQQGHLKAQVDHMLAKGLGCSLWMYDASDRQLVISDQAVIEIGGRLLPRC
jgi:hypothetical protein